MRHLTHEDRHLADAEFLRNEGLPGKAQDEYLPACRIQERWCRARPPMRMWKIAVPEKRDGVREAMAPKENSQVILYVLSSFVCFSQLEQSRASKGEVGGDGWKQARSRQVSQRLNVMQSIRIACVHRNPKSRKLTFPFLAKAAGVDYVGDL